MNQYRPRIMTAPALAAAPQFKGELLDHLLRFHGVDPRFRSRYSRNGVPWLLAHHDAHHVHRSPVVAHVHLAPERNP